MSSLIAASSLTAAAKSSGATPASFPACASASAVARCAASSSWRSTPSGPSPSTSGSRSQATSDGAVALMAVKARCSWGAVPRDPLRHATGWGQPRLPGVRRGPAHRLLLRLDLAPGPAVERAGHGEVLQPARDDREGDRLRQGGTGLSDPIAQVATL